MSDNPFAINTVKVDKWQPNENDKNNCYWNIAKNQLGEGASAAEIQALSEKLQQLNLEKNSSIAERDGVLYEGDQVFLPLEQAMDEISTGVTTKREECTAAQTKVTETKEALTEANTNVQNALAEYQGAQAALQGVDKEADNYSQLQTALNSAREAYTKALNEQKEKQAAADEASKNLETKKGELNDLNQELSDIKEEYATEKDEYEKELSQLDKEIQGITEQIGQTETELNQAKETQEKAQAAQDTAKELGATEGEDGKIGLEKDPDPEKLEAAMYASKEVAETKIIDGGRTKFVKYADGSSAEFYKDPETGKFKEIPGTTYEAKEDDGAGEAAGRSADGEKEVAETKIIDGGRTKFVKYADGSSAEFHKDPTTGEWKTEPSVTYGAKEDDGAGEAASRSADGEKEVAETKIIDGGRTKFVKYADGSSAEFHKDPTTGEWKTEPSVTYEAKTNDSVEFPEDMTTALTDLQKNVGADYLKNSDYYVSLSEQLMTQKDSDGLVIDSATQQAMYTELKGVEGQIDDMKGVLDKNSPSYNKALAEYCENGGIDLTSMYLEKIDSVGVEQATKEMKSYVKNVQSLMGKKAEADAKWDTATSKDITPTQKLMLQTEYGSEDVSMYHRYDLVTNEAYSTLGYYTGGSEYDNSINQTSELYDQWSGYMDEIIEARNVDSHLKNQGCENDAQAKEIIELYNDFMENHYKGGFIFSNQHDKIREQAESIIKNYLYGTLTSYDPESLLRTLHSECNK